MDTIAIIGGGSSAHVLVPFLSKSGFSVNLLTSKPELWNKIITAHYVLPNNEYKFSLDGLIDRISNKPEDIVSDADLIIFCMPVYQYRIALHNIAPYINKNKKVFLGTIYGQAGFNWMVNEIEMKFTLNNLTTFAIGLIPWICRTREYGKIGVTYGSKARNFIALSKREDFEFLNEKFLDEICFKWFNQGKFTLVDNFLSLTLSVDNQIIHPSRLYGLYIENGESWERKEDVPFFYRDYTEISANLLKDLDDDYSKIRQEIIIKYPNKKFTYMLDYLELERVSYNSSSSNILESFINSQTLGQIQTPVIQKDNIWTFDHNHRFFFDDIFYGLCIAKWFAEKLNLEVQTIDKILYWAQNLLCENIIENHKLVIVNDDQNPFQHGIPTIYGYTEIIELID